MKEPASGFSCVGLGRGEFPLGVLGMLLPDSEEEASSMPFPTSWPAGKSPSQSAVSW